jgi:hypothetical protein
MYTTLDQLQESTILLLFRVVYKLFASLCSVAVAVSRLSIIIVHVLKR